MSSKRTQNQWNTEEKEAFSIASQAIGEFHSSPEDLAEIFRNKPIIVLIQDDGTFCLNTANFVYLRENLTRTQNHNATSPKRTLDPNDFQVRSSYEAIVSMHGGGSINCFVDDYVAYAFSLKS